MNVAASLAHLLVSAAQAQMIVPDGRTETHLLATGHVTDVTTRTTSGENAFNSFHRFNVDSGSVVNLYLPDGTSNLLNVVTGEATQIDGMLNSVSEGFIAGNVYFANPHGIAVGRDGVINVGSLSLTTPAQSFVDGFFDDLAASAAAVLDGSLPAASSLIRIDGGIRTAGDIRLDAADVAVAGILDSTGRFPWENAELSSLVNTRGWSVATDVRAKAGDIVLLASRDVTLDAGAQLTADNRAVSNDGGGIVLEAAGTLSLDRDAELDGGSISISSENDLMIPIDLSATEGPLEISSSGDLVVVDRDLFSNDSVVLAAEGDLTLDGSVTVADPDDLPSDLFPSGFIDNSARGDVSIGGSLTTSDGDLSLDAFQPVEVDSVVALGSLCLSARSGGCSFDVDGSVVTVVTLGDSGFGVAAVVRLEPSPQAVIDLQQVARRAQAIAARQPLALREHVPSPRTTGSPVNSPADFGDAVNADGIEEWRP